MELDERKIPKIIDISKDVHLKVKLNPPKLDQTNFNIFKEKNKPKIEEINQALSIYTYLTFMIKNEKNEKGKTRIKALQFFYDNYDGYLEDIINIRQEFNEITNLDEVMNPDDLYNADLISLIKKKEEEVEQIKKIKKEMKEDPEEEEKPVDEALDVAVEQKPIIVAEEMKEDPENEELCMP